MELLVAVNDITSITVSWRPPSGVEPEFYRLLNYLITWHNVPLPGEELGLQLGQFLLPINTRHEIHNLNANTSYGIVVSARSSFEGQFQDTRIDSQTNPLG